MRPVDMFREGIISRNDTMRMIRSELVVNRSLEHRRDAAGRLWPDTKDIDKWIRVRLVKKNG